MRRPGEPLLNQARAAVDKPGEPDREALGQAIVLLERAIRAGLSSGGEAQAQVYIGLVLLRLDPASRENRTQAAAAFERALSLRRWGARLSDQHLRSMVGLLDGDYVNEARRLRQAGQAREAADFLRGKYVLAPDVLVASARELAELCQAIGDEAEANWCRQQLAQARVLPEGPHELWMECPAPQPDAAPSAGAAPAAAESVPAGQPAGRLEATAEEPPSWSWGEEPLAPDWLDELQTVLLALAEPATLEPPAGPGDLYNRAVAAQRAGDFEAAARLYEEALEHTPGDAGTLANLGALRLQQDRPAEAESLLSRAVRRAHGTAAECPIQVNVGLAAYRLGDVETARRAWLRAIELAPGEDALRRALAALLALVAEHWRGRFRQAGGSAPASDGSAWLAVIEKAAEYAGEAARLAPESAGAQLVCVLAAAGVRDALAAADSAPGEEARRAIELGLAAAGSAAGPAAPAAVQLIRGSLAALLAVWSDEPARTDLAAQAAGWLAATVETGADPRGRAIARYFAGRLGGRAADTIESSLGRPGTPPA